MNFFSETVKNCISAHLTLLVGLSLRTEILMISETNTNLDEIFWCFHNLKRLKHSVEHVMFTHEQNPSTLLVLASFCIYVWPSRYLHTREYGKQRSIQPCSPFLALLCYIFNRILSQVHICVLATSSRFAGVVVQAPRIAFRCRVDAHLQRYLWHARLLLVALPNSSIIPLFVFSSPCACKTLSLPIPQTSGGLLSCA